MENTRTPDRNLFDDLRELPPQEASKQLTGMVRDFASSPAPESTLDAETIDLLADRRAGDPLLEHLPLECLEILTRRCLDRHGVDENGTAARAITWQLLDILRRSIVLQRISAAGEVDPWADRILALVEASHFTFGHLFLQRAAGYGERTLFLVPTNGAPRKISWWQAAGRVDLIARALLAATSNPGDRPVALLSRNRPEMALVDLACLTAGIKNVIVPPTSTETDIAFILEHAKVGALIVSDKEQLQKVLNIRDRVTGLGDIYVIDAAAAQGNKHIGTLDQLLARSSEVSAKELADRRAAQRIDEVASVMYTSGTTGTPKGICFTQRNIVFKRFARALALPEIGERDVFLSYLPLFHTFGRFLEMTGCIFWGATYCFADDPSIHTLAALMREHEATVMISVPMKWMQLYDQIRQNVDVVAADDREIEEAVRKVVGPSLRWGLSAAGYLDPEIFQFFQRNGVELMSGFGMTEATGGITMTPPGCYKEDSLGPALPGIEMDLAEDGELVIRGPYVMAGYLDPPDDTPSFDDDGWFHTGDLMERDEDGFIRIVDRKKEIYKNIHGETIAPQKIENLFRDFDSVARIFLVGDHRPYNTALIFPNADFKELDLGSLSAEELKTHFRSLVVSANSFLAPYERIIDFAIIDRDFSGERGELTAKGTYRRKTIERSFSEQISLLYRRRHLNVGGAVIVVPNWIFQALGITAQDLRVEGEELILASQKTALTIRKEGDDAVRIGSAVYCPNQRAIDLGHLLSVPRLWLGNGELVNFAPLEPVQRDRRRGRRVSAEWLRHAGRYQATDEDRAAVAVLLRRQEVELLDLHRAALLLANDDDEIAVAAVKILDHLLHLEQNELDEYALRILRRAAESPSAVVRRRAFQVLATAETPSVYRRTLAQFLDIDGEILDTETISVLVDRDLSSEQIGAFIDEAEERCHRSREKLDPALQAMCDFLSSYGAIHPSQYRQLRGFFTRAMMTADLHAARELAGEGKRKLAQGFRQWLGSPSLVAVDPETGLEYRWEDVVEFADDVDDEARSRILAALRSVPVLREASFLFDNSPRTVRLDDILPGGVFVRLLGSSHGKSVYRVSIQTRERDQLNLALNLNRELPSDVAEEEINWLIVCSEAQGLGPLVEIFGGAWPEHDLWTEEFIPGETLDRALHRLARKNSDQPDRLTTWWPFAAWSAVSAYVDFWHRTSRRLVASDPSPANVIVPMHDYHTGARLVSISNRAPFDSIPTMLRSFDRNFIKAVEVEHPELEGIAGWDILFSAVLEIIGEQEGAAQLRVVLESASRDDHQMAARLRVFLESVSRRGFLPRRLFFAAKRFRRWQALNSDATLSARAETLQEIFMTYGLVEFRNAYPEARARFFRETVFADSSEVLVDGLEELISRLRSGDLEPDELSAAVADLRAHLSLEAEEDYFLARLSYPYLRPEDEVEYVAAAAGGTQQSEMVVSHEDSEGGRYQIRHALSPKEVGRLHRLFLTAKMPVQFRPEHRFLVVISERGSLIGGLFYEEDPEAHTAHMDKIVVADQFQGRGIARALLEELRNRLKTAGFTSLTTGFFRPQFFYSMGFTVEKRYAGLYQSLLDEPEQR